MMALSCKRRAGHFPQHPVMCPAPLQLWCRFRPIPCRRLTCGASAIAHADRCPSPVGGRVF